MASEESSLEGLRNLGPATCKWLRAVGLASPDDLARVGAAEAWLHLRAAGFRPSRVALWALQGALLDLDWREIPPAMKRSLLAEVAAAEGGA